MAQYECKECAIVGALDGISLVDERTVFSGVVEGGKAIKAVHAHLGGKSNRKMLLVHFHEVAFVNNTNEWIPIAMYTVGTQLMMVFYRKWEQRS